MSIQRLNDFWSTLSPHARQQIIDQRNGASTRRNQTVRANQQAVQQGRVNAALPEDAWVEMDNTLTEVVRDELRLVSDLVDTVGTHRVPLTAKLDTWDILQTHGDANLGMDPDVAVGESTVTYGDDGQPIPVAFDPYSIGFRDGPADGQGMESSIETQHAANSSRLVSGTIERSFVNGSQYDIKVSDSAQGFDFYGLTDHPNTAKSTTSADWTTDNSAVRQDIIDARAVLKNVRNYSPSFGVYLGNEYYDVLDEVDPEGDGNLTIRERVDQLSGIQWIRELDALPDKAMLMLKPTSDVIEVGMAADIQPVQQEDMFRDQFVTLGSMYPRVYSQYNVETEELQNGILYWTAP